MALRKITPSYKRAAFAMHNPGSNGEGERGLYVDSGDSENVSEIFRSYLHEYKCVQTCA